VDSGRGSGISHLLALAPLHLNRWSSVVGHVLLLESFFWWFVLKVCYRPSNPVTFCTRVLFPLLLLNILMRSSPVRSRHIYIYAKWIES